MNLSEIIQTSFKQQNKLIDDLVASGDTGRYLMNQWTVTTFTHCMLDEFD
jgi:hypothetical protein